MKIILNKVNKTIGLLRKLQNVLPRSALLTIYKSFIRPHLDYGDIIYDQAYNASFHQKLELLQYNACLAITGAIRGTSREKLYEELGLEFLQLRRWFRKLSFTNSSTVKSLSLQTNPYLVRGVIPPPFLDQSPPFLIFPLSRNPRCPHLYRFIGKTKVLNNSCNRFVRNFYRQSNLVLEECLEKW